MSNIPWISVATTRTRAKWSVTSKYVNNSKLKVYYDLDLQRIVAGRRNVIDIFRNRYFFRSGKHAASSDSKLAQSAIVSRVIRCYERL